jgi:hypothetical protein
MENIQAVIQKFIDAANARYPDLVEPEEFAELLVSLYKAARLILSQNDFHVWVNDKAEVAVFLTRRIHLNRNDIHVRGNPLGHYKVMVYGDEGKYEYVEIEWVARVGVASSQKVFRLVEPSASVPLGELVSTLQSFEVW